MTTTLREQYLIGSTGPLHAATKLMDDLMAGDPETFKQGYSADNALIAAHEVFGDLLSEPQWTIVANLKKANRSLLDPK